LQTSFPDLEKVWKKDKDWKNGKKSEVFFGIAPYLRTFLLSKVKPANGYVLLFDESLNSNLQSKQLDIHICFWEGSQVSSNFYASEFLGHADKDSLHEKLIDCCASIGKQGLLQISIDGPV